MRTALRASALSSFALTSALAGSAHAITDPSQPQQDPNQGNVVVMGQPGQPAPGQPAVVQQPPPPRLGIWGQLRAGGGVEFHGLPGPRGNAFGMLAGGYNLPSGVGFSLYAGGRYLFNRICDGDGDCTGPDGSGVLDIEVGLLLRYTAFPQSRLHPVGEIGGQIHILPAPAAFGIGYGAQAGVGLEFDLTPSISFDAMLRGQLFVTGWSNASRVNDLLGVRVEPMIGMTLYL
jgi:hypothetical protein